MSACVHHVVLEVSCWVGGEVWTGTEGTIVKACLVEQVCGSSEHNQ